MYFSTYHGAEPLPCLRTPRRRADKVLLANVEYIRGNRNINNALRIEHCSSTIDSVTTTSQDTPTSSIEEHCYRKLVSVYIFIDHSSSENCRCPIGYHHCKDQKRCLLNGSKRTSIHIRTIPNRLFRSIQIKAIFQPTRKNSNANHMIVPCRLESNPGSGTSSKVS
jgi:hypothetical protein